MGRMSAFSASNSCEMPFAARCFLSTAANRTVISTFAIHGILPCGSDPNTDTSLVGIETARRATASGLRVATHQVDTGGVRSDFQNKRHEPCCLTQHVREAGVKNIRTISQAVPVLIVGLGLATNRYSQSFLRNGLAAYYPFNGKANGTSENGNEGTLVNAALATDRFGLTSDCFSFFPESQSSIQIMSESFPNGVSPMTVSLWAKIKNPSVPGGRLRREFSLLLPRSSRGQTTYESQCLP